MTGGGKKSRMQKRLQEHGLLDFHYYYYYFYLLYLSLR